MCTEEYSAQRHQDRVSALLQTEAEKAARKLASEAGMDIVTIHPTFVLGPVISQLGGDAPTVSKFKVRVGDCH